MRRDPDAPLPFGKIPAQRRLAHPGSIPVTLSPTLPHQGGGGAEQRVKAYGNLLHVDLTSGRTWSEPTEAYAPRVGGRGLNSALLFKSLKPGTAPLGPDNVLVFSTGPIAGTIAPSSCRYNVSARSPLTGFYGDSNSGGFWASEMKYAGYDGIVIHGKSPQPVYLLILDDEVKLLDAGWLWGHDTWETEGLLREQHRDQALKVAAIGPAGENLVRFACVVNDRGRVAGRTGMGAVMGSKNLKAIAIRGKKGVTVARPDQFRKVCERLRETIRKSRQFELYHQSGVILHRGIEDYRDDDPSNSLIGFKYFSTAVFKGWGEIGGKEWWKTHWTKVKGCGACQMHCSHFYNVRSGPFAGIMAEGIDGEAMGWLTVLLGGSNKDVSAYGHTLLNRLGLDNIEMCTSIATLMKWYEQGVITNAELKKLKAGWLRPQFGDPETIFSLINMTAHREGIGDLLAEGPYRAAQKIGRGADYWLVTCKGMAVGGGDRRPQKGGLLNHMVSCRGPDHLRGSPSLEFYGFTGDKRIQGDWEKYIGEPELFPYATRLTSYTGKASLVIWQEHLRALSDSFGVCSFNYGNWPNTFIYPDDFAELFSTATGEPRTAADIVAAAERAINTEKAFNIREGWERAHDQPPARWAQEAKPDGVYKGERCELEKFNVMLDEYYWRRGWDWQTGLPTAAKLESLGLKDVADELGRLGKLAKAVPKPPPGLGKPPATPEKAARPADAKGMEAALG